MEYATTSALVKDVLGKLTSVDIQEFGLLWGFKDDVMSLKDDFDRIESVLQDAQEKHKEKAIELWLKSLKSALLDVENVLDEISTEAMIQQLHKDKGIIDSVSAFFSSDHNPLIFQVRIAYKVKALRIKVDAIASKILELKLTPLGSISHVDVGVECLMPNIETSLLILSETIIGRTDDMKMALDKICNKNIGKHDSDEIRVYGIWGMGGVGKTALAHLIYNHERVNQCFELKLWVCVFEKFNIKEVIKRIIESIDKRECALPELDMLQESLRYKLKGKKYILVLDGVWIEDNEKNQWDQLSETLSCGAEGSIVVITTRYDTTSRIMAKVPELQHKLGCLSKEDSWLLFKKLAFIEERNTDKISDLGPIGREIVEKCRGLPLEVKTLGSLIWSKSNTSDWELVKDNHKWELQEDNILPALKLSYDNLLPNLKRCFAYCCLFPKGYDINKDELIPLWVSNGFIQPRDEIDLYVLGEEIFNNFIWRSFISKVNGTSEDRYIMHDMMHDMARHVMEDECLVIEPDKEAIIPYEVLHLSSSCPDFFFTPQDLEKMTSLRSVFMYGKINEGSISQISNHAYLRVLYLRGIWLKTLPESICKLKHLRYLNVSHSSIKVLPDSISYLQNLQVLLLHSCQRLFELPESICQLQHLKYLNLSHSSINVLPDSISYLQNLQVLLLCSCQQLYKLPESIGKLQHLKYLNLSQSSIEALPESIVYLKNLQVLLLSVCSGLRKLPEGLRYMTNLQRLDNSWCYSLMHLPQGIKELTSLRILSIFPLGNTSGAKIGELGNLNHLEGELEIVPLVSVAGFSEAKSANLKGKRNLQGLLLRWSGIRKIETMKGIMRVTHDEVVLEGLEPNPSLKRLEINSYMGNTISPSWMVNLRNLVEIIFFRCTNCEHIPPLGKLPNLRVIRLSYMESLKCLYDDKQNMLGDTTNRFICLQKLHISECPNLVSLPSNLPTLEVLTLVECGRLLSLPDDIQSFKDLNKLEILRCVHLSARYEREKGVDWPKISHILNIRIDPPRYT